MNKQIILSIIVALLLVPSALAEETHNVIIKAKEPPQQKSFFSIKSTFDIEKIPKEKIKYEFKDTKYAKLTSKEINELKLNPNIEISEEPKKQIFMQDAIYLTNSTNIWEHKENNINITGKGETICIIDTGINHNHSDFGNCYGNNDPNSSCKIIGGWDYCADNTDCSTEDSLPEDVNGHGTHVAGIASANGQIKGIAPESKLIIIKVFNENGSTYDTPILNGLDWCINNATKFNITTISMSLGNDYEHNDYCDNSNIDGVEYNPPYTEKINLAKSKNITVTIATGNDRYTEGISSPACIENATRIGSITKSNSMSNFTNRGDFFQDLLLTYGTLINSTMIESPSGNIISWCGSGEIYCEISGTSMSTPMAAGMITLLKQYKKVESNKTLTTNEVEEILINSSEIYSDTPSGGNYSIINSYQTILYADESPPIINLISPQNSSLTIPSNQTFSCNATDMQLKNLTLQIFNSTGLLDDFTNSSPVENKLTINQTFNLSQADEYTWNCYSYDNKSNYQISSNYTISTKSVKTTINSPTNNSYTNQNQTIFNCSAQTSLNLTNITFSIYNSTNLLNTSTKNITGTDNQTTFNYTLQNETIYFFNCLAQNNESYFDQTKNYSITYDITSPKINLTSPANNTRTQTKTHTFTFNETELNKDFCNLTINSINYQNFTQTLTDGNYKWNISCTDKANNTNTSKTFNLEIYTEPAPTSSGSSSSSSSTNEDKEEEIEQNKTYTIEEEKVKGGFQQEMNEKDSIKLKIKSKEHTIILNEIKNNSIEITIKSDPINITLYKNQPAKINLNSDNFYDLELLLIEVDENAKIFAKEINQTIPNKHILQETPIEKNQTKETPQEKPISTFEKISKILKTLFQKLKELFFKKFSNYIVERNIY